MIIIPMGTDAPVYYWPRATVSLIASCTLIYLVTRLLPEDTLKPWTLMLGHGLHPRQWLTYNLLHIDWLHLIGNMIFLWSFGLIVEGKVGPWKFLAICAGIGIVHGAILQAVMMGGLEKTRYVLGASVFIYGLLAITLIWAPRNELNCFVWIVGRPRIADVDIYKFALFYIATQIAIVFFTGAAVSTELVHTGGAILGIAVGLVMLKANWVDCEEWDLIAVLAGRAGKTREEAAAFKAAVRARKTREGEARRTEEDVSRRAAEAQARSAEMTDEDRAALAARRLRKRLDDGNATAAYEAFEKGLSTVPGWQPDRDWLDLIKALETDQAWRECVRVMQVYLDRVRDPAPKVRLKLASILLTQHQRPAHARRILAPIEALPLDGPLATARHHLNTQAERMLREGVLEVDGDAW